MSSKKKNKAKGQLVNEWRDLLIYENPERPGVRDLRRKSDGKLHYRATAQDCLLYCKDCRREHAISWQMIANSRALMVAQGIDRLLLFCVNCGDPHISSWLHFWQPGASEEIVPSDARRTLLMTWELKDDEL